MQQHLQINVGHLKSEMVRKLGAERSKLYFFYLNRFLSLKITKVEFNKICFRVLGRENIVLHNRLITSILRNAFHGKEAPLDSADESGSHEKPKADILPSRSNDIADQSNISALEDSNRFSVVPVSEDEQSRVCNDSKIASGEDWTGVAIRRHLQAPLGFTLPVASTGGSRGTLSSYDCGGLLDSVTLKHCMDQIAMNEGLQGVSLNCANLLNNGLDSYLKSLIRSSIAMAGNGFQINKVSLLDFRVAMELKPQQLGEDWPLLLEKMCAHSYRDL